MVVPTLGLSSGSNEELPPDGSRQAAMPMPASVPAARSRSRSATQIGVAGLRQHLVDHRLIVAAVVGRAARNEIRKLFVPDQVAPPHFEAIETEFVGDLVDGALDRIVGRRLAERAHRLLHRLVGDHRNGLVLHALDLVRPDDGADRLAELKRRAPRIGAHVVERPHLHRADHALVVERHLDVEIALRPVHVAAAHVFQPVLDQPHRHAEPPRQIADQHRVLDAALDAVAAADVDVVVHPHRRHRQLQRHRGLVGILRHLDRGPDVEDLAPRVPACRDAEGLDRHRRAAAPFDGVAELVRARGEILLDLAPHEGAVEQHVRAVRRMHQHAAGLVGLLAVEHERQRLVFDRDQLGRVLRQRPACRPPPPRPIRRHSARRPPRAAAAARSACRCRPRAPWSRRQAPRRRARSARRASPAPPTCRSRRSSPPDTGSAPARHA